MPYDPEMKEIIEAFVSEGCERIEEVESQLPYLQEANHEQIVQTIFRLFHSLKGLAGYLNFENIKQLTHEAESLLDLFRKTKAKSSAEDVDLIYRTMDFMRQLLDNVAQDLTDEGFETQVELMVKDISDASVLRLREKIRHEANTSQKETTSYAIPSTVASRESSISMLEKPEEHVSII